MPPRWEQVREFFRKNRYQESRTDPFHYLKLLPDGTTPGTMVSMGKDGDEISASRWTRVWRRQLGLLSEEDFWRGLRGEPVNYAIPPASESSEPLAPYLQRFLRDILHQSDDQIAATSREEAQSQLNAFYARELGGLG
jgi:hypothetical protein